MTHTFAIFSALTMYDQNWYIICSFLWINDWYHYIRYKYANGNLDLPAVQQHLTKIPMLLQKVSVLFSCLQSALALPVTKQCHLDRRRCGPISAILRKSEMPSRNKGGGISRLRPSFGLLKSSGILSHAWLYVCLYYLCIFGVTFCCCYCCFSFLLISPF